MMVVFHAMGDWLPRQVLTRWSPSTRPRIPAIETAIEEAWAEVQKQPGVRLFDGPMCRMEAWALVDDQVELTLSDTSYKPFLGTNLKNPQLALQYGRAALANPVGVSPALLSSDGYLMLGRRNHTVAYYPGWLHPFAGALDPCDVQQCDACVFNGVRRELAEELSLRGTDIELMRCTGIVEDVALLQPELIFRVSCNLKRAEIEARLDKREHGEIWAVKADPDAVVKATLDCGSLQLTPIARSALLLYGRAVFGKPWFEQQVGAGEARP